VVQNFPGWRNFVIETLHFAKNKQACGPEVSDCRNSRTRRQPNYVWHDQRTHSGQTAHRAYDPRAVTANPFLRLYPYHGFVTGTKTNEGGPVFWSALVPIQTGNAETVWILVARADQTVDVPEVGTEIVVVLY